MNLEYTDHKEDYVTKYVELHELLIQRDNEIEALKHMLDRKDEEKMSFVVIKVNLPTPKRAKLPKGWVIKGGRVEHD